MGNQNYLKPAPPNPGPNTPPEIIELQERSHNNEMQTRPTIEIAVISRDFADMNLGSTANANQGGDEGTANSSSVIRENLIS